MGSVEFGYKLSAEEFGARVLVEQAKRAEDTGFSFAAISDHFHPWTDDQGESPFVWSVLGAIATATSDLKLLTGVTCPTIRIHPALVAHAAATTAALMPGRFSLGLGTGEALNEHVIGERWPSAGTRRKMLAEAIEVIRGLFTGENFNHHGTFYTVENARLYTLPDTPPPLLIAASGDKAVELAATKGDGLVALAPDPEMIEKFNSSGGSDKPKYAEVTVCWASDRDEAMRNVPKWWPIVGMGGELSQELPLPRHFEQAASNVTPEDIKGKVALGPDPDEHLEMINKYVEAGYDHIWIHQVGPDQEGFFDFYATEVLPKLS